MTRKSPGDATDGAAISSFFPEEEELLPGLGVRFASQPAGAGTCLALVDLASLAGWLAGEQAPALASFLHPAEQALFAALHFPKRNREWLGGRLAGKAAVLRLESPPASFSPSQLSILPAANGAPQLSCPARPAWPLPAVSLSHSGRYAVALAVWHGSCGVDIQRITAQTVHVADRFAQPAEMELLRQAVPELGAAAQMTLLWAGKEALKKGLLRDHPTLFWGVTLLSLVKDRYYSLRFSHPGDRGRPAVLTALNLDEYMLAFIPALPHA